MVKLKGIRSKRESVEMDFNPSDNSKKRFLLEERLHEYESGQDNVNDITLLSINYFSDSKKALEIKK